MSSIYLTPIRSGKRYFYKAHAFVLCSLNMISLLVYYRSVQRKANKPGGTRGVRFAMFFAVCAYVYLRLFVHMPGVRRPSPDVPSPPPPWPSRRCSAPGPCASDWSSARACRIPSSSRDRSGLGARRWQTRRRSPWWFSAKHAKRHDIQPGR